MKLPGATYGTPVQSLGRLQGPTDSGASSAMAAGQARAAVWGAVNKLAGVAEAWYEAEEEVKAMRAVNEYKDAMSKTSLQLKHSPTLNAADIPEGVNFERERTGDDGAKVIRETVPAWEVTPAYLDHQHRLATQKAMSQVTSRKMRAAVENSISDSYRAYSNDAAAFYLDEKKKTLTVEIKSAVQAATERGDEQSALKAIDTGFKTGLLSPTEAFTMQTQARNEAALNRFGISLGQLEHSTEPYEKKAAAYGVLKQGILAPSALTASQRVSLLNQVGDQHARMDTAEEKKRDKVKEEISDRAYNSVKLEFDRGGRLPTNAQLVEMEKVMRPQEFQAMMSFVIDKRKAGGGGRDAPGVKDGIAKGISGLYSADPAFTVEQRADALMDSVNKRQAAGELTHKTAEELRVDIKQNVDRSIGPQNTRVKAAEETLEVGIKGVKGGFRLPGKDDFDDVIAETAKRDLRAYMNQNPKGDPTSWAEKQLPIYQRRLNDSMVKAVRRKGADSFLVYDTKSGAIDMGPTKTKLLEANKRGVINDVKLEEVGTILDGKVPSGTASGRGNPLDKLSEQN